MKHLIRLIAAVAAALLAGTLLATATTSASAAPAPTEAKTDRNAGPTAEVAKKTERAQRCRRRCFGAISMSPDQAWGGYYNTAKKKPARNKAHRICKRRSNYPGKCRRMGWVRNGCMAVAIKTNRNGWITSWSSGYANKLRAAKRKAKRRNNGGHIRAWVCTAN